MEIKKSVSIVIPNYNGKHLLKEYLPFTLDAIKSTGTVYEIIVVDDRSTDGSAEFLRSEYPEVLLIINPENKGFSYTCNRGIEVSQYELILLLNSDVKLSRNYFDDQWKYFMRWDTFGVMGRITDMGSDKIQDAARVPKFKGLKLKTDYFYYTNNRSNRLYTLYLSGANALISAEKLKMLGGFNELFSPFYCEDMDLSLRAWQLNWNCYYEHNSVCQHRASATTKKYAAAKRIKSVHFRNRFYVHAIHLKGTALLAWYVQITLFDLLPRLLIGQLWIWKSYISLFINRKEIRESKKQVKSLNDGQVEVSIFMVVDKIRSSVKNKKAVRFKP